MDNTVTDATKKSSSMLTAAIVFFVILALGAGAFWYLKHAKNDDSKPGPGPGPDPPRPSPGKDWVEIKKKLRGIPMDQAEAVIKSAKDGVSCRDACANQTNFTPAWAQWSGNHCACFSRTQLDGNRMSECVIDGDDNTVLYDAPDSTAPEGNCPQNFVVSECHEERMPGLPLPDGTPGQTASSSTDCAYKCLGGQPGGLGQAAAWVTGGGTGPRCMCYTYWLGGDLLKCYSPKHLLASDEQLDFWTPPGASACPTDGVSKVKECAPDPVEGTCGSVCQGFDCQIMADPACAKGYEPSVPPDATGDSCLEKCKCTCKQK